MVYEILGIERFEGISKKTGKPYDFTRFYAVPSRQPDKVRGRRVEQVDIWNANMPRIFLVSIQRILWISPMAAVVLSRNAVWSILQTSGCEVPGSRCSLGAGNTPFPLTTERCQVPGGSGSSCHGCTYGAADIRNVTRGGSGSVRAWDLLMLEMCYR